MNILLKDDLKISERLEISTLGDFAEIQWDALVPRIQARIILEEENTEAVVRVKAETLPSYNLNSLITSNLKVIPV